MKKIIILLSLFLLSSTAWALKEITFETQPGFYPAVIPLEFRQDGVTLSIYGTAYPPGYSYYNTTPSFVSTSQGAIISIKLEEPTCSFVFYVGPNGSGGRVGSSWHGEAQKVFFKPYDYRAYTGRIVVTIDEENDYEPTDSGELIAIYQNGNYNYCKTLNDEYVLLYGNVGNTFVNGDTIAGDAELTTYGGSTILSPQGDWRLVGHGPAVKPVEVPIEELTADMDYHYLCFKKVDMDEWVISDDTGDLTLYNKFGIQVGQDGDLHIDDEVNIAMLNTLIDAILTGYAWVGPSGYTYNVEGFLSVSNRGLELIPTRISRQYKLTNDINGDGELNLADVNALIDFIITH